MRISKIGGMVGLLLAVGVAATAPGDASDETAAKAVGYADLGKVVRGHRGKVVVVDFWANY
jgi:hypothetical protein